MSSDGGAAAAALVSSAAVLAYDSWLHGVVSAPAERDTSDDAEAQGDSVGPTPILDAEVDEWRKPRGRERVTRRELAALAPRLHQARGLRVLSLTGADASAHEVARAAAAARVPLVSLSLPRCGEWLRLARGSLVRALSGGQPLPRVFTPTARTNAQLLAALADLPTLRHLRLGSPCGAVYVASRKNTQRGFALGAHDSDESDSESDSDFLSTAAAGTGCGSSQGLGEKLADSREELLSASALLSTLTEGTLPQASAAVRGAQQPGVDVARAGQKSLFVEVFTPCVWHRQDESPPYSAAAVHLVFSHVSFATADPGEMKCGGPRLKSLFVQVRACSTSCFRITDLGHTRVLTLKPSSQTDCLRFAQPAARERRRHGLDGASGRFAAPTGRHSPTQVARALVDATGLLPSDRRRATKLRGGGACAPRGPSR